ncbi:MAG: 50S ribosomal protein L17 [Acidobacteria bacterium 13_1_20CM_3_53_8]|nr:MAG: 50S ribosomal protein L17 [Acidobacteria bacterium 13_1_20CM_3_53_8]
MRHLKAHRKLGRTTEHRISLLRNLATSLINSREERIITTLPKAKELRPFVERVITCARRAQNLEGDDTAAQSVHLRRQAASFFHAGNRQQAVSTGTRSTQGRAPRTAGVAALKRLFDELGERYKDRPGGYTRIIKLGHRVGDNAELAIIELVDNPRERASVESQKKRAKSSGKKTAKASESKAAEGGRRGGRKADRTSEKEETTKARGKGEEKVESGEAKSKGASRSRKTESTAEEKETE